MTAAQVRANLGRLRKAKAALLATEYVNVTGNLRGCGSREAAAHVDAAIRELEAVAKGEVCPGCRHHLRTWNDHAADCRQS